MIKLVLNLPGFQNIISSNDISPTFNKNFTDLGSLLSNSFDLFFYLAGILLLAYLLWGGFRYLTAGDSKESVAKARARITYALIGFVVILISFAASQYLRKIFRAKDVPIQQISTPTAP